VNWSKAQAVNRIELKSIFSKISVVELTKLLSKKLDTIQTARKIVKMKNHLFWALFGPRSNAIRPARTIPAEIIDISTLRNMSMNIF
jgi:hypothetical protein